MSSQSLTFWRARIKRLGTGLRLRVRRIKNALLSIRTLICAVGLLTLLVLFIAAITPVRYDISIGDVPTHTITANRDVVDEITTESLRKAAENAVHPTYHFVEGVTENVLNHFDQIFTQLDAAIQYSETLDNYGPTRRYVAEELAYAREIVTMLDLRDYQMRTLLNTTRDDLNALYSTLYAAVQNTMNSYVTEGLESEAIASVMQIVGYRVDTSLLQNIVQPLLREVIEPNMVIDQEATAAARQLARDSVEPIVYKQGQNIVVRGEGRVERYQYDMLSNLGLLNDTDTDISIYLGAAALILIVLLTALTLLRLTDAPMVRDTKRLTLLFVVTAFTLVVCILARMVNIYLSPVIVGAMLLSGLLGIHASVIFNAAIALLVSALAAGGSTEYTSEMVQLLACALCSGSLVSILLFKRSGRLRIIGAGIAAAACNFAVMLALGFMTSSTTSGIFDNAFLCAGSALISSLLCIAAQPLLEAVFNLPTNNKLMELSNPNHPLQRRLLLEAPGTYHHSIVVANLAEAAAEAIGANPLLARVGGYYHDIGKLRRPQFFKENQLGSENRLTETDPYTAAQIVLSHPRDGVLLGRNYHLPREVLSIIQEHHGNTPVMYFYTMAVKAANGAPVDASLFRYNANPPSTKEGAIVLLCDTIEAAVRSMYSPTPDAIEEFIVKLIRGKLQDGQLSQSPLTLKDIDTICHACATVLNGVFHERIEYPDSPLPPPPAAAAQPAGAHTEAPASAPWDGLTPENYAPPAEAADEEEATQSPDPIIVEPEQFEAETPLPLVEPDVPEEPLSVDELLERTPEPADTPDESDKAEKEEPEA